MRRLFLASLMMSCAVAFTARAAPQEKPGSDKVVVSGTVPDNATKAELLKKLRSVYGAERVVDQLGVGGVVSPAKWGKFVTSMITPELKNVSHGKISVQGNTITIDGEVPNEATRQQVLSKLSQSFNGRYSITQSLKIVESKQAVLDKALADRTIEFKSGSAILTPAGRNILDQMAEAIMKLDTPFIQIIGNTDNVGNRMSNIQLSLARAQAVKDYLVDQGIPAKDLSVSGQGPDNPVASNDTEAGRARNRRIDFRITNQ